MSAPINVYDAKTQLSQLLNRVENGEEIVIARNGRHVARLAPLASSRSNRTPGLLKGRIRIADDFDEFSPSDEGDWYGR
jgi:prevent-host-death family protein